MLARMWIALGALNAVAALLFAASFFHATDGEAVLGLRMIFEVANNTHMFHALALIAVGLMSAVFGNRILVTLAGVAFLCGILLFSGGIYAGFAGGAEGLRRAIPVGGILLFAGWALLTISVFTLGQRKG